jgi:Holliday junction resolvasome RuvABC DNA-binding subunit
MVITQKNKCAMCGKDTIGKDRLDNYNKENEQKQQQENKPSSIITTMITVEQINDTYYFDTEDCAMMFKKFMDVYGSSFSQEVSMKFSW